MCFNKDANLRSYEQLLCLYFHIHSIDFNLLFNYGYKANFDFLDTDPPLNSIGCNIANGTYINNASDISKGEMLSKFRKDRAERHCLLTTTLVIHSPFLLPSFIRREEKKENNKSRGKKIMSFCSILCKRTRNFSVVN